MDFNELYEILPKEPKRWNKNDIEIWLKHIGLEQYLPIFQEHAIDGAFLDVLNESDLTEIGIEQGVKRKKLIQWINIGLKEYTEFIKQKLGLPSKGQQSLQDQQEMPFSSQKSSVKQHSIPNVQVSLEQPMQEVQQGYKPVQFPDNEEEEKYDNKEADQLQNNFDADHTHTLDSQKSLMIESFKLSASINDQHPPDKKIKLRLQLLIEATQEIKVIEGEEIFTIGRSPESSLVYKEDYISRLHCQIFYDKDSYFLKDCGSSSGTFIQLTAPSLLKQGLILEMGSSQYLLQKIEQDSNKSAINVELLCLAGTCQKYKFDLVKDKKSFIFGRVVEHFKADTRLSAKHAQFFAIDEGLVIEDLHSSNGTWLRLSDQQKQSDPIRITHGRRVRLSIDKYIVCNL